MAPKNKDNFFKLVTLIVDIACHVICRYIRQNILGSSSFESFLNLKKVKHKLVHVYETRACCECVTEQIKGEKLIAGKQLLLLYKSDETKQIKSHKKYVGKHATNICICNYVAKENIDVEVVDITLANHIFQKCGKNELGVDQWMKQIRDMRNEIYHLSDIQEITDDEFSRKWKILEGSILGISNVIDSAYVTEIEKKIHQTKKLTVIPTYMLTYEKLCRDYWRNKCAEFERAQIEEIEKKTKALHTKLPSVFSESLESDCQNTMKEIQNLQTIVDNINILIKVFGNYEDMKTWKDTEFVEADSKRLYVPVFLQLDLPASWNRTKVYEHLDEMRLNGTSDMDIRILAVSPDDLRIYSEIARRVLRKVDILQDAVNKMMSGLLSGVAVDTKHSAEVGVSITTLDITEEIVRNSGDELEQKDNLLVSYDGQTRTNHEFDESEPLKFHFQFYVELRRKFRIQSIRKPVNHDCLITNDQLVFIDYVSNILLIFNINEIYNRDFKLSQVPQCISVINDNELAVSHYRGIEIININTEQVKNTIVTRGVTSGISYQNGLIYVVIDNQKIDVMQMTGEIVRSFHCPFQSLDIRLSTDTDRLFLSDPAHNTLYCCDLNGSVRWKFTNDKMHMPGRVTTDKDGNVYVVCFKSNNMVVVSPDGKHHKELLTEKDGLRHPRGIYYNKSNDCLLVCNARNCDAFLFDVKHSVKNE